MLKTLPRIEAFQLSAANPWITFEEMLTVAQILLQDAFLGQEPKKFGNECFFLLRRQLLPRRNGCISRNCFHKISF